MGSRSPRVVVTLLGTVLTGAPEHQADRRLERAPILQTDTGDGLHGSPLRSPSGASSPGAPRETDHRIGPTCAIDRDLPAGEGARPEDELLDAMVGRIWASVNMDLKGLQTDRHAVVDEVHLGRF